MASVQEEDQWVVLLVENKHIVIMQGTFRPTCGVDQPSGKAIRLCFKQFKESGSVGKCESPDDRWHQERMLNA